MQILSRYIFLRFSRCFAAVFVLFVAIVWLTQTLRLVDFITARGVSLYIFIRITVQLIIPMIYFIMPLAALISAIVLIYNLYQDREITIFRTSGLSNWVILKPIIGFCLMITCLHYLISFYLLPKTYRDFKDDREYYKNRFISLLLEEGVFNTQSNSLTVYIDQKIDESYFKGIFIHDIQKRNEAVTIIAESGYILRTPNFSPEFILYNGTHQKKNLATGNISITTFDSYKFNISNNEPAKSERALESNELYINQLFSNLDICEVKSRENIVNGTQRIIWPLYTLLLPILAGSILLFGQFSRRGVTKKALLSISVSFLFSILAVLFNSIATKHIWALSLMYLNVFLIIIGSIKLLIPSSKNA